MSEFTTPWFFKNGHIQTLCGQFSLASKPKIIDETLVLNDQKITLSWNRASYPIKDNKPIVILIHGLLATLETAYIKSIFSALVSKNLHPVFITLRSDDISQNFCVNKTCNDVEDLEFLIKHLQEKYPENPIYCIGYSLGGNVLLKYLHKNGVNSAINKAVAVSVPFDIKYTGKAWEKGIRNVYNKLITKDLKKMLLIKSNGNIEKTQIIKSINSIREYEKNISTPLYGYKNVDHFYEHMCVKDKLQNIHSKTLIVHAKDDPLVPIETLPKIDMLSTKIEFELYNHGGHIGFVNIERISKSYGWLENRIFKFLSEN